MSTEHNHHHETNHDKHDNHCKPSADCCSLWKTIVLKGIWVVYPILGVCLLHTFWLLNDRMDNVMYNTVAIHEKPAAFVDTKVAMMGSVQKGMDLKLIKEPSGEMLKAGKVKYQEACASCHGPEGKGDGPAGIALKARNFQAKDGWKNGRELSKMFGSITSGTDAGMPAFDYLPVDLRISLIHYIRSFTKDYPEVQDSEVKGLDEKYTLSKNTVNPHRIPIKVATMVLSSEAGELNHKNHALVTAVMHDVSKSAELLKANTDNLDKTICSLQANAVWKKDIDSFVKFITVNIGVNGVKADLLLTDKSNMEELFSYLKGLK